MHQNRERKARKNDAERKMKEERFQRGERERGTMVYFNLRVIISYSHLTL